MESVGLTVDTYNLYMVALNGTFDALYVLHPKDIFAAHVNDVEFAGPERIGGQSKRCFPSAGVLNVEDCMQRPKEISYDGALSVETFRTEYWAKFAGWAFVKHIGRLARLWRKMAVFE